MGDVAGVGELGLILVSIVGIRGNWFATATYETSGGQSGMMRRRSMRELLELELSRGLGLRGLRERAEAFAARYLVKLSEGVCGGFLDSIVILWGRVEQNGKKKVCLGSIQGLRGLFKGAPREAESQYQVGHGCIGLGPDGDV